MFKSRNFFRKYERKWKYFITFGVVLFIFFCLHTHREIIYKSTRSTKVENIDEILDQTDKVIISEYRKKLSNGKIEVPNEDFIFHNKFPKCGSTTLNYILLNLARKNKFNYEKINAGNIANTIAQDAPVIQFVQNNLKPPYLLLKHNFFVNFTSESEEHRPTYINIIRDPLEWVTSKFYFARYGWKRDPGCRGEGCSMSKVVHDMSLDECVEKELEICTRTTRYFYYLCGPTTECFSDRKDLVYKKTRERVLNDYFFIGLLEHLEESLQALELLLPRYFKGAVEIYKTEQIQRQSKTTITNNKKEISEKTKKYFEQGPLKYEKKLYDFTKNIFKERLNSLGIELK